MAKMSNVGSGENLEHSPTGGEVFEILRQRIMAYTVHHETEDPEVMIPLPEGMFVFNAGRDSAVHPLRASRVRPRVLLNGMLHSPDQPPVDAILGFEKSDRPFIEEYTLAVPMSDSE